MAFVIKDRYDINDLLLIMELLRSPGGCPWDMEQDHHSIRANLIEETYEVLDAIDANDTENLREELGDLLLQIVFHSRMEEEIGSFDFGDVCNDVCQKLVHRHPHVFGSVSAETTEQVLTNWDNIKAETKGQKTVAETMDSVPRSLPALMRAVKLQKKAAKVGFDWPDIKGAAAKVAEETSEVMDAYHSGMQADIDDELGDLLFAVVNLSRFVHTEPEEALTRASDKFARRFAGVERLAAERGIDMASSTIEELDKLWDEIKIAEREND
ncbi:MAG: nucleoside triphosphate pyrophosphohydrolase [Ruminococcaceae bacterium]|nr:nucleoside triphosphate pyrophosphohydrolase [Oscillospiraceae bacterium]